MNAQGNAADKAERRQFRWTHFSSREGLGESDSRSSGLQESLRPTPTPKILAAIVATIALLFPAGLIGDEPAPSKSLEKSDGENAWKEGVGLLSGLYLYQTYLNIGLLADGKAEKVYDEKAARAVLATVVVPLEKVDKQLEKLAATPLTASDREALSKIRSIVALLQRQGKELTQFWDTAQPSDGARYEATRQEAWKQINALLALDKK